MGAEHQPERGRKTSGQTAQVPKSSPGPMARHANQAEPLLSLSFCGGKPGDRGSRPWASAPLIPKAPGQITVARGQARRATSPGSSYRQCVS